MQAAKIIHDSSFASFGCHCWFNPKAKRFLTADSYLMENVEELVKRPHETNLYGYAGNDPIKFFDQNGDYKDSLSILGYVNEVRRHVSNPLLVWVKINQNQRLAEQAKTLKADVRSYDANIKSIKESITTIASV